MTSVFDQFGYFTSWWSSIIAGVVIIGGALIVIKICLDCPGLVHFICCCGHNPDSQVPTYKLEIVYRREEEEEEDSEDIESSSEEEEEDNSRNI